MIKLSHCRNCFAVVVLASASTVSAQDVPSAEPAPIVDPTPVNRAPLRPSEEPVPTEVPVPTATAPAQDLVPIQDPVATPVPGVVAPSTPAIAPSTRVMAPSTRVQGRKLDLSENEYDLSSLPQITEGRYNLPKLAAPSIATDNIGNGRTPERFFSDEPERPLPETASERGDSWNWTVCEWAAPNTFSFPRYFEDRMLERHGHRRFGICQPAVSGARFFGSLTMLPYLIATRPGNEPEYTLGYYRAGSNVPGFFQRPPFDRDALIIHSATTAGVMMVFP